MAPVNVLSYIIKYIGYLIYSSKRETFVLLKCHVGLKYFD